MEKLIHKHCDECNNENITHVSNEGNTLCEKCAEDLFVEESILDHEYSMVFDRFDTEYWKEL